MSLELEVDQSQLVDREGKLLSALIELIDFLTRLGTVVEPVFR